MVGVGSFLGFSTDLSTRAWTIAQYFFAGLFVVLSGISSTLSRGNIRRALKLVAVALLVTAATFIFDRHSAILFGILHCLAVSILIYGLVLEKAGAAACAAAGARRLRARRRYRPRPAGGPHPVRLAPAVRHPQPGLRLFRLLPAFPVVRDIPRRRGAGQIAVCGEAKPDPGAAAGDVRQPRRPPLAADLHRPPAGHFGLPLRPRFDPLNRRLGTNYSPYGNEYLGLIMRDSWVRLSCPLSSFGDDRSVCRPKSSTAIPSFSLSRAGGTSGSS